MAKDKQICIVCKHEHLKILFNFNFKFNLISQLVIIVKHIFSLKCISIPLNTVSIKLNFLQQKIKH